MMLCLILIGIQDVSAQKSRFLKWAVQDPAGFVNNWSREKTIGVVGATATAVVLTSMDEYVRDGVQPLYAGEFRDYIDVANELGGPRATLAVVGVFMLSLGTDDERFQDAAFTSLEALVYSGAINYAIKYTAGRYRPETGEGPFVFGPLSGNTSFPSGHTNAAFAILTPWAVYYPSPLTYALVFIGAGGTGFSRIARHKHWASDTLIGGAMGAFIGYQLARQHKYEKHFPQSGTTLAIRPVLGPGGTGVRVSVSLGR